MTQEYCWCDYHCCWNRFLDLFRGHIWAYEKHPVNYCKRCLKLRNDILRGSNK